MTQLTSWTDVAPMVDVTPGMRAFLERAFNPSTASTTAVARCLGIHANTLTTRFRRAGLPSPKRYIALARLVQIAEAAEAGRTLTWIAVELNASSGQHLSRFIRSMTGLTSSSFRASTTSETVRHRFVAELIDPHRETLRAFVPAPRVRKYEDRA